MDMKDETPVGLGGDPALEARRAVPAGRSWREDNVRFLSGSARTQAQEHSPQLAHAKTPRDSHDREPPKQNRSTVTATRDNDDPMDDHDIGLLVAIAHRHPQITHAPATSCPVCTCARRRWC